MNRILSVLLCVALLVAFLTGCQEDEQPYVPTGGALADENETTPSTSSQDKEEDLAVSLVYDPSKTLNPFMSTDYTNRVLFSLIYQGLFAVDDEFNTVPMLCQSFSRSLDMKTYTFYLAGAYFSDGTPLTSEDVVASLEAAKNSPYFGKRLQQVATITAQSGAVVITLATPMENLPILLDIPIVKATQTADSYPVGTGPFLLDNSPQGKWLRRQPGWWCNAKLPVTTDFITLVAAENPTQIRDAFEQSGVSLVCADPSKMDYADYRKDHELWDCENGQFLYLVCNSKSKLFSNPAIQSALTYAINRESLVDRFYHGFGRAATLAASPDSPYYNHTLSDKYRYDPQKFAAAIAEANVKEEDKAITMLLCSDDPMRVRVGTAIAQMLEEAGLVVTLSKVTYAKFDENLRWGTYDLYLGQTKLSANMDLSAFFSTKGSLNYGGLSDPGIHALCLEALANTGNYYNLHKMIADEGQLCPILFQQYAVYVHRGILYDLQPARDNLFYYDLGKTLEDALIEE